MALPTPLTPAQVGGSNDTSELRVSFATGPNTGMVLLVSKTDPNLAGAVADGSVVVEDPGEFTAPSLPATTLISIDPLAAEAMTNVLITGTGFEAGMFVEVAATDGENITVVSPTEIRADFDLSMVAPGPYELAIYPDGSQTSLDTLAVSVGVAP